VERTAASSLSSIEILGHSQITLTLDTYSTVLPSVSREAAAQMDAVLSA
jgi:hypothetical protein